MPPIPAELARFLATSANPGSTAEIQILVWLALLSTTLTATLLSYGTLLLAVMTRLSRRPRVKRTKRLLRLLRIAHRQGLLSVAAFPIYFVVTLLFFGSFEGGGMKLIVTATKNLAVPITIIELLPVVLSWSWKNSVRRSCVLQEREDVR